MVIGKRYLVLTSTELDMIINKWLAGWGRDYRVGPEDETDCETDYEFRTYKVQSEE